MDGRSERVRNGEETLRARRRFLRLTAGVVAGGALGNRWLSGTAWGGEAASGGPGILRRPEKVELLHLTNRPPNLEMPLRYFREDFTPNEAFYVRWHLAILPTR